MIVYSLLSTMLSCSMKNNQLIKEKDIQVYIDNNFHDYKEDYNGISDLIKVNANKKLIGYASQITRKWQVDRLIIFNKEKTKCFTTVNTITNTWEKGTSDLIKSLYGVKIKEKWHVYLGNQNLIAMRDGYKYDIYEPFTWDELSYVAHEQMFGRYIKYTKNRIEIDFDQLEKDTGVRALTGKSIDEVESEEAAFLELTDYYQSRKIDSLEYQDLLNEINNPVPKERESIKKISWWDKLWGAEEPIFDSKEWKEYIMSKQ
jgi:hypothetical protein